MPVRDCLGTHPTKPERAAISGVEAAAPPGRSAPSNGASVSDQQIEPALVTSSGRCLSVSLLVWPPLEAGRAAGHGAGLQWSVSMQEGIRS